MNNLCAGLKEIVSASCGDFSPPTISSLVMKITKKGKIKVRINGVGKWLHAEFDKVNLSVKVYI